MVEFTILGVLSSSFDEVHRLEREIGDRAIEAPLEILLLRTPSVAERARLLRERAGWYRDVAVKVNLTATKIDAMAEELEAQVRSGRVAGA